VTIQDVSFALFKKVKIYELTWRVLSNQLVSIAPVGKMT